MLDKKPDVIFKPAQSEAVQKLLDKRTANGTLRPELREQRFGELALSIKAAGLANTVRNFIPLEKLSADHFNDIIDRLYVDIYSLYRSLLNAEQAVSFKKYKATQKFNAVRNSFLKLKSDAKSHLAVYSNPEYDDIRKITFSDRRNNSAAEDTAIIDSRSGRLTLRPKKATNIISQTTITPTVTFDGDDVFTVGNIQNMVDPDPETFWQAMVMAKTNAGYMDGTITLRLGSAQNMSAVYILPFASYPLKVQNLEYSTDGTNYSTVPSFSASLATQNTDYVPILFSEISAKYIRITLRQYNAIDRNRLLPSNYEEVTVDTIRENIKHAVETVDYSQPDLRSDSIKKDLFNAIVGAVRADPDRLLSLEGYEYLFGISDISLYHIEYNIESQYAGPKFVNNKNTFSIELDITEQTKSDVTVEYNIEIGNDRRIPILPRATEGLVESEVLQFSGRSYTGITRFAIDNTKQVIVYENGEELPHNYYYATTSSITLFTNISGFTPDLSNIYTASYTVSSGGTPVYIHDDLLSIPLIEPEIFTETTPTGRLSLKTFPHVEYSIVNDLVNFYQFEGKFFYAGEINTVLGARVNDIDTRVKLNINSLNSTTKVLYLDGLAYGNAENVNKFYEPIKVTVDRIPAINVTDYVAGKNKTLSRNPFGGTVYEYIHEGNELIFGTRIAGKEIKVQYNVMAEYIRPIVTLRRTTTANLTVTPELKDITLLMKARTI